MSTYSYIDKYQGDTYYTGKTRGCGCCSDDQRLSSKMIEEYIESLKEDIKEARKALRETKRQEAKDEKEHMEKCKACKEASKL